MGTKGSTPEEFAEAWKRNIAYALERIDAEDRAAAKARRKPSPKWISTSRKGRK